MIDKVPGKRIANDNNYYLIEMWKSLQKGWIPPEDISKKYYYEIKENQNSYEPALVAFAGFLCSFGGKWFGGYAFNNDNRNYAKVGSQVLLQQIKYLKDVEFICEDYRELDIPDNSIVYADPPYKDTTKYKDSFDHEKFWDWARDTSKKHKVYISEYTAPEDFNCLVQLKHKTILNNNSGDNRVEKLFSLEKGNFFV